MPGSLKPRPKRSIMKRILFPGLLALSLSACQPASQPVPTPSAPSPSVQASVTASPSSDTLASTPSPAPELVGDLQADLQTDKPVYNQGEDVKVTVIAMGLTESAWVWVVPEEVEVKPTARPTDSSYPSPTVGTKSPLELKAEKAGKYQLYLFPSSDLSAPIASRGFQVQ